MRKGRSRWGKAGLILSAIIWALLLHSIAIGGSIANFFLMLVTLPVAFGFSIAGLCLDGHKGWAYSGLTLTTGFVGLTLLW